MTFIITVLGLIMGSFINALVWRLHKMKAGREIDNREKTQRKHSFQVSNPYSVVRGRSMCPHCKHTLGIADLTPVFSWIALRGKCRYCQKSISWQYPLIELTTAVSFAASFVYWPRELAGAAEWLWLALWLASVVCLIALAAYDFRWMLLPDKIMRPLIVLSGLAALLAVTIEGAPVIRNRIIAVAITFGLFYALALVSRGKWIGGGDIKFGIVMGLWLGAAKSVVALLLAFYSAALVVLPLLALKKLTRKSQVPFGPFLIAATFISMLFGQELSDWYRALMGL